MASYYVWSGATGSANGTSWANAYTTMTLAYASGKVAGDVFYVAHDHLEATGSNIALSSAGSKSNPIKVICVNRAGSVPPVSADRRTTAQVTTTANGIITLQSGTAHYDGIIFIAGNSTGASGISIMGTDGLYTRLDNCSLQLGSTGGGIINIATGQAALTELNNTTMSFSAVGQKANAVGKLNWRNTPSALIGSAVPTTLFVLVGSSSVNVECIGVDLSAAGSGKTLVGAGTSENAIFRFIDCKLNASVTKAAAPTAPAAPEADFIRSGSAGVNYTVYRIRMAGELTEETTIVRTGGASDGTTPLAWKVVTTANCTYSLPFECPPIAIWNDATGSSVTATVEGIWGGGAVPNDDDIWLDVEYLGDASSPQGSFINDGKANLLTAAAGQTSSSETWGGSTTKFKLNVTFTAQQKGWIFARVKCAKASSTFYIDPLITLT